MKKNDRKKNGLWKTLKRERTSYLMLLPNIIMFAAFTVYPLCWACLLYTSRCV